MSVRADGSSMNSRAVMLTGETLLALTRGVVTTGGSAHGVAQKVPACRRSRVIMLMALLAVWSIRALIAWSALVWVCVRKKVYIPVVTTPVIASTISNSTRLAP